MYAAYSALLALALVVGAPWFLYQAVRRRKYLDGLGQRFGALPVSFNLDGEPSIWIHAVSVGEVLGGAAAGRRAEEPVSRAEALRVDDDGRRAAAREASDPRGRRPSSTFRSTSGGSCGVSSIACARACFVLMEGEIWPNVLRECSRREVKTLVVNGRVSTRSFARYRLIRPLLRRVLAGIGSLLHAERRVGAPHHGARRRSCACRRHRQPEVRRGRADRHRVASGPPAGPRAAVLPVSRRPHGDCRRQHDARRGDARPARLPPDQARDAAGAADRRAASPGPVHRGHAHRAGRRVLRAAAIRAGRGRGSARRRRGARLDRRAGADLPDRHRRVRRRQPRARRRPQHPRARGPRTARSFSARTCRTSPRSPGMFLAHGAAVQVASDPSSSRRSSRSRPTRCAAPRSAPRRERSWTPTGAPPGARSTSWRDCCRVPPSCARSAGSIERDHGRGGRPVLTLASRLYALGARARRSAIGGDAAAVRRLDRPVVSVGNLVGWRHWQDAARRLRSRRGSSRPASAPRS